MNNQARRQLYLMLYFITVKLRLHNLGLPFRYAMGAIIKVPYTEKLESNVITGFLSAFKQTAGSMGA
jgi:hypothetical protein